MLTELRRRLWDLRRKSPLLDGTWETLRGKKHPIFLEFPIAPKPRYGYLTPPHAGITALLHAREAAFRDHLRGFLSLDEYFRGIPLDPPSGDPTIAAWNNGTFPALDAVALCGFLARLNPETYLEVGYGNSTKFAHRTIRELGLKTRIVAIDPYTKPGCDQLCDEIQHSTLEAMDLDRFRSLRPGDILFIDGSHWVFQNSDVVVFFLDILPLLAPDVWIHIHDIPLPNDYGPDFVGRYWSEQYMLAAYLLGGGKGVEIELANHYVWKDTDLVDILAPLRAGSPLGAVPMVGSSFWLRTTGTAND